MAQNGYGPFFLIALPMIAVLVLSQAGEDAAKIMALVLIGVMFFMGVLLKDFYLSFVNSALMDRDYRPMASGYLSTSKLIVAENKEPWFPWLIAAPLSLALTFAILLPARSRLLPILFCAGLLVYGQIRDTEGTEIAADGALTYVRAEARGLAKDLEIFLDWAKGQFGGEEDG